MVKLARRPREVPLARDPSSRFVPAIVGAMVFLATLVLAASLAIDKVTDQWQAGHHPRLTVEVSSEAAEGGGVNEAMSVLLQIPGITGARPVSDDEILETLEAWTGGNPDLALLPLPALIDVETSSPEAVDVEAVRKILAERVSGVEVYAEARWLWSVRRSLGVIQLIAAAMLVVTALVSVASIVYVTRTAVSIHRNTIEILHQVGAHDSYVANQFQVQSLFLALVGGLPGTALAVLCLIVLREFSGSVEAPLVPAVVFGVREWLILCALPVLTALVTMMAARMTVTSTLGRMP